MAIGKLKLNLKGGLKKQIEDEKNKKGGSDPRFLNYYDLKDGDKLKVLILPDINGELWAKFRKHGPNMKGVRGIGSVRCSYESSGDTCAACGKGFEYHDAYKETKNKEYQEEARKWFARDYTLMSVLVLESPFEVSESPDGNQVKLFYAPFAIENIIKEAITEGQIEEEDLCSTPFFIKKTTNGGGFAEYTNSYFARKQVSDEEMEFFEDKKVEQFDYTNLDVIPAPTSEKEVADWVAKVEAILDRTGGDDEEEEKAPAKDTSSRRTPSDDIDEDEDGRMGEGPAEGDKEATPPRASSLRDRLNKLK